MLAGPMWGAGCLVILMQYADVPMALANAGLVDPREKATKGMLDSDFRYRRHGRQLYRS